MTRQELIELLMKHKNYKVNFVVFNENGDKLEEFKPFIVDGSCVFQNRTSSGSEIKELITIGLVR